jgi:hypothetical protein
MSTQTEIESLDHLDFDAHPGCDYTDCAADATHRAICPRCSGSELFCTPHVEIVRNSPPGYTGRFDKTCGHTVLNREVRFEPLA